MPSFVVGLLVSLAGLALLYASGTPVRIAGGLLAAAGVVFVFSSPADPSMSIILLVLVLVLATMLFGSQWLGRHGPERTAREDNGRIEERQERL